MEMLIIFAGKYLIMVPALIALYLAYRLDREKRISYALVAAIGLPLAYVIAKVANHFYINPRPFVVENIVPLIPHIPDNGFPSDHTLLAAALAFLILAFNRTLGVIALLIAALIAVARVLAHVHHTLDVVGSFVISGFAVGIVAFVLISYKKSRSAMDSSSRAQ